MLVYNMLIHSYADKKVDDRKRDSINILKIAMLRFASALISLRWLFAECKSIELISVDTWFALLLSFWRTSGYHSNKLSKHTLYNDR